MASMDNLAQQAIEAALKGEWKKAEKLNAKIIEVNPNDKEALNRLGRAAAELGKTTKAKKAYKKVLKIDPYNIIAQKVISRLTETKKEKNSKISPENFDSEPTKKPTLFIEEPGKTKVVRLIHLGSRERVSQLDTGEKMLLTPHSHRVSVQNKDGKYIGRLPDDLSRRLIKLMKNGNKYETFVKSATGDDVRVFIKETQRGKLAFSAPSFPTAEVGHYSLYPPLASGQEE